MDIFHFQSSSFKETEIKREIHIDEQLLSICSDILKENLSVEEWAEIESDDMFQTENYEGGFDGTEKEFVFSFYDDNEYWFQMTLQQVKEVSSGQLKSVFGIQSDYYND
jgi:predicted PP-loop superfamily ATPase